MPVPIICLDEALQHFAQRFSEAFSKPQYQHFVTVLLGLMLCESRRTLSGLLHQIAAGGSLAGLSRFLAEAPWDAAAVTERWLRHFREMMQPVVEAEQERQRQAQPKRRGRPKPAVVTGYLIGDDSTIEKRKGKKMEGLALHHSTTQDKRVRGRSLVESLYVLLGRRCPLAPQLYGEQAVCTAEGVPFHSKIDLMEAMIRSFEPVAGTLTHVLLDSWYSAKRLWRAAQERGFLISSGLKSHRWLRVENESEC
jgi:DDE superfamily endonuclease